MMMTDPDLQPKPSPPVMVHVLTGFLGSGKTTFLNRLLKTPAFARSAVIINEFGEIGLDHHLMEKSDDSIIELSNGCLCCTVRGQLIETIERLIERCPERIIIETTGLADPVPVLQALLAAPAIAGKIQFAGVITVFDCDGGKQRVDEHREAALQVQLADWIVISKLDLQDVVSNRKSTRSSAVSFLQQTGTKAVIEDTETLLANPERLLQPPDAPMAGADLAPASSKSDHHHDHEHGHGHGHGHDINRHDARICSTVLVTQKPLTRMQLDLFCDLLLSAHGDHVLRLKGLVAIEGSQSPLLVQAVGRVLSEPRFLSSWPDGNRDTQLVVILYDMKPEFVQQLFAGFSGLAMIDTPDHAALAGNPLSIPGIGAFRK